MTTWTEGVCGVGAAILKDGEMVPVEDVVVELNKASRLEAALRELTGACVADFGDGEDEPREPDESSVFVGVPDGKGITFGMLRRARAALR